MNTKTSKNEVSIINHEVNYLINIVDNLKYSMIPDNYTWIYEEIIERINESSDNCIKKYGARKREDFKIENLSK